MATILLVEDSPTAARACSDCLRSCGHEVRHISDGSGALEVAAAERPDGDEASVGAEAVLADA